MAEMLFFNIDEGYTESILRGMRLGFLKEDDYNALRNCANMADFKMVLEDTDYAHYILPEQSPIEVPRLKTLLKQKLWYEINYIQTQSSEPLTEFLDLMRHGFMIENIVNIIEGIKNKVDLDILLKRADPLGEFPEMKNIRMVEGDDYGDLYQTVLIDLPIGKYFHKFLEELIAQDQQKDAAAIPSIMKDFKPEKIKNLIRKIWLTDFHRFCEEKLDGPSEEFMTDLLKFESDCMTIQIIYNSIGSKILGSAKGREGERKQYIHPAGYLYPGRDRELTNADDFSNLKAAVQVYPEYLKMLDGIPDPAKEEEFNSSITTIDDVMFAAKARKYALAFESQFHVACYYAYLKLKEQEIRNIVWLAELVSLNVPKNQPGWKKYIVPFSNIY